MIKEGVHERLADVYDEFDRHSRNTNTRYSIDADYFNMQGYRVMDCPNFQGFLRHITNYVKDKQIDMEVNGTTVNYDNLQDPGFSLKQTEQPIFKFTLSAIQEEEIEEMQRKSPTTAHTVRQAPFRSSIRPNKPGFQYETGSGKKKKTKKKTAIKDSFENRLNSVLAENLDLSFSEPEVLFTKDSTIVKDQDYTSYLYNAKNSLTQCLDQYHYALKNVSDENMIKSMNDVIENCTNQINTVNEILGGLNGTSSA